MSESLGCKHYNCISKKKASVLLAFVCACVPAFVYVCVRARVCVCVCSVGFALFLGRITVHLKALFSGPCPEYFVLHRPHYSCKQRLHQSESRESHISGLRSSA